MDVFEIGGNGELESEYQGRFKRFRFRAGNKRAKIQYNSQGLAGAESLLELGQEAR